jgi:hypothetical protein
MPVEPPLIRNDGAHQESRAGECDRDLGDHPRGEKFGPVDLTKC